MAPRKRKVSEEISSETNSTKTNKKRNIEDGSKKAKKAELESKKSKNANNPVEQDVTVNKGKKNAADKIDENQMKKGKNKVAAETKANIRTRASEDTSIKSKKTAEKQQKPKVGEDKTEEKSGRNKVEKVTKDSNSSIASPKKKLKKEKKEYTEDENEKAIDELIDPKLPKITREIIQNSQKWVGAHVSIAGGLYKAVEEACSLESNAFGLFLRSQRRWESPPLTQKSIDEFEKTIKEKKFGCSVNTSSQIDDNSLSYFDSIKSQILPHGSYLINLGNPDKAKYDKSYSVFLDDLKRCDSLSIALYNFHPGSTCGETTVENSLALIAKGINNAHKETKRVKIVIENMAGQGNIVGSKFEELADIIKFVENKNRVGICLDTCHLFAAGYDIRTVEAWNKTLDEFDRIVGLKYLSALHLNDSKGPLGCNKDRHESIGKGYIGIDCFKFIMEDSRFCNMPLILETPDEKLYFKEIQLLHSFLKPLTKKEEIN